ncbi:class I SAM-dependent methyltransferase [Estrella lausannensis]|uniref:Type 11 methyltransferase n=1 Tax=Estrella lausannensis TaxID=483423 RepID=A0A0H5DQQ9_9BACT|nr:class I SAM-dependent methyltransferase [Estrella lausannensis]CRX37929.1 type 11 methyltransferase [Estrella lausannensis]
MKDLFSKQAAEYAKYRPGYPRALYDCIFSHVRNFDQAWDCATGNGQAAVELAAKFQSVIATDMSRKQIEHADQRPNITYQVCPAEKTPFPDHCFDLVTVAQALHWFDFDAFYPELERVLKPEGFFAAWSYGVARVTPEIDRVVDHLYHDLLGSYWDGRRALIDEEYRTIPFPLKRRDAPSLSIELDWTLEHFISYFARTWSAVQTYVDKNGVNPVDLIAPDLEREWRGAPTRKIRWPIYLLMGVFE